MPLPSRSAMLRGVVVLAACLAVAVVRPLGAPMPAGAPGVAMTVDQVMKMPKIDAHAHIGAIGPGHLDAFIAFLDRYNLRWLNICVGGMNWPRLQKQIESAQQLHRAHPERLAWASSFNLTNWGQPDWAKGATDTVASGFAGGAVAVKIWKDVGMVLKDPDGRYVMADDARMDPVLDAVERQGHTLVAHLGEPRNCWLPLDAIRILYGTDFEFGRGEGAAAADPAQALARLAADYVSDATWLATDQEVAVERARAGFKSRGLALPEPVLRKLYFENARKWYPGL